MLWALFTVIAAASQTLRNALQRDLTARLGVVGATHVRFLFGFPFAMLFLGLMAAITGDAISVITAPILPTVAIAALAQIGATGLMLAAMQSKSFVVATAYTKTEPVLVALFGLVFLGESLSAGMVIAILIATAGVWAGGRWCQPSPARLPRRRAKPGPIAVYGPGPPERRSRTRDSTVEDSVKVMLAPL